MLRMLGVDEFTTRPRGGAGLKNQHSKGNLFEFPKLILWGDVRHRPTIDKGREARELGLAALHIRADPFLKDIST